MTKADQIRSYAREKYVLGARKGRQKRFSIKVGDIVRELGLTGRAPAVCSALKTRRFLQGNDLLLVEAIGPKSGQSTTVSYTYQFIETRRSSREQSDPWKELRGTLKDVFAKLGGGEAYLRSERSDFYSPEENQ